MPARLPTASHLIARAYPAIRESGFETTLIHAPHFGPGQTCREAIIEIGARLDPERVRAAARDLARAALAEWIALGMPGRNQTNNPTQARPVVCVSISLPRGTSAPRGFRKHLDAPHSPRIRELEPRTIAELDALAQAQATEGAPQE